MPLGKRARSEVFPLIFPCPSCGVRGRAGRAGAYRCPSCGARFMVAATGTALLTSLSALAVPASRAWLPPNRSNEDLVPGFDLESGEKPRIELARILRLEMALEVRVRGVIDAYNSAAFRTRMAKAIEAGFIFLVFDCRELRMNGKAGAAGFHDLAGDAATRGGRLALFGMDRKGMAGFEASANSGLLAFGRDREEALKALADGKNAG